MKRRSFSGYAKIIAVNLLVFLALLVTVNLLIIGCFTFQRIRTRHHSDEPVDPRAELAIYKGMPWAKEYFLEDARIEIRYYSHYGWRRMPFNGKEIVIDENGIRCTPQYPHSGDNRPLIVLMGGSTMWGIGSNDQGTIPALLAQDGRGQYRTVNYGEVGYSSYQDCLFLYEQLLKGVKPAVVVSYDGVNNKYFPGRDEFGDFYENDIRAAVEKARVREEDRLTFRNWLFKPLQLVARRIRSGLSGNDKAPPLVAISDSDKVERARELLEGWLATEDLCDRNNIPFLAVLQPNAFTGTPIVNGLKLSPQIKMDLSYYPYVYQLLEEPRYAKVKSHFADYTRLFDDRRVYIDFCHVIPAGNQIIADTLARYIKKLSLYNSLL